MTCRTTTSAPPVSPAGDPNFAEIRSLVATIYDLHVQQAAALALTVQGLISTSSRDVCEIEYALDQLLDCACIPEGLAQFKYLCRYYYGINSASTACYVDGYREMWDSEVGQEQGAAP